MLERVQEKLSTVWRELTHPVGWLLMRWLNWRADPSEYNPSDQAQEEAREEFLRIFADRSWRYTVLGSGIPLFGVATIDLMVCWSLNNQAYGLALDLTGAVILGRGLIKGPVPIARESTARFGYSPPIVTSLIKDSVDGVFGITFLVTGVLLQFIAVANLHPTLPSEIRSLCSLFL